MDPEDIIPIGIIGKAHGLHGEVRVSLYNPSSVMLSKGGDLVLIGIDGSQRSVGVETVRQANKRSLVRFEGVPDKDAAERLKGTIVAVHRRDLPRPGRGEFYYHDVLGLPVRATDGSEIGRVVDVMKTSTDILVINGPLGECMVPVVEGFVVDIGADVIVVEAEAVWFESK